MADLQIEPPDESEQETLFGTIFLRFGATFICALFGLLLVFVGYLVAIFMDLDLREFNEYTSIYFSISIVIWILIGLFTPFALFQRLLDELKGWTFSRVIVILLVIGTFVMLHWYMLSFAIKLFASVFGAE